MYKSGDNTMGFDWSGLGKLFNSGGSDTAKKTASKIYSADELADYNKAIARGGIRMGTLSDNLKNQLETTYTPYEKAVREWSNKKQREEKEGSWGSFNWGNLGDALGSIFTGGISDIVQGEAPGSGVSSLHPLLSIVDPISKLYSAGTGGIYDIAAGIDKGGKTSGSFLNKVAAAVDRSLDPSSAVDTGTRYSGEAVKTALPAATPYLQSAGTAIGTLIGALTPITPFGGALVGNALGGKLQQGTTDKDYLGSWQDAGIVAGTYGLGKVLAPYLSDLAGGGKLGKIVGSVGSSVGKTALKTALNTLFKAGSAGAGTSASTSSSIGSGIGIGASLLKALSSALSGSSSGSGVDTTTKALRSLTGTNGASMFSTGTKSSPLNSIDSSATKTNYAKDAISKLVSTSSELSDAVSNSGIKNTGMIKDPAWSVNTADMDKEEKIDYMQAIKQLVTS